MDFKDVEQFDSEEEINIDRYILLCSIAKIFFNDVWKLWGEEMIIEPKIHGSGWYSIVKYINSEVEFNNVIPTLHELLREPLKNYISKFKNL